VLLPTLIRVKYCGQKINIRVSYQNRNCTVTWCSRKQRIVAQSTAEAENISLAHCIREVIFLRQLLGELGYEQSTTQIYEDNQACISMAENPVQHSRTKHIDVRYHFVREKVNLKEVKINYVESKENVADILTKGLERPAFKYLSSKLGMVDISERQH
jgi:hypothetical protein